MFEFLTELPKSKAAQITAYLRTKTKISNGFQIYDGNLE